MSEYLSQFEFNKACSELKNIIDSLVEESGFESLAMAISCGITKKEIMKLMVFYELEVIPKAKEEGIVFKTSSELFGCEVKITEVSSNE
ncbi:hypothetical protein PVK64_19430 [Aliivibrio sp. S4TY2]|uniref:hypothetical protein n=1 Tax=unclassified Aliivibrio TaxID=2645654 RepID=UPI002379EA90|nr:MULTISPECIES: hypothetical protein [unclassified Aliivibrio]MDD9158339.1 hypothetical protein [Aliivibrio sp. S4TY2]MDD9162309.1 hypothetical protein [Aliivibrio sp. S4TY1]MDD9166346.1 hypothetical protein [Aliivibrio sp. S4MY2]MDD9170344.1 hypothetical protein [Aliivibrio sp. S4MY4]MDD9187395.1 hypothetical protein [Aliivibrio sp. S4MY3]